MRWGLIAATALMPAAAFGQQAIQPEPLRSLFTVSDAGLLFAPEFLSRASSVAFSAEADDLPDAPEPAGIGPDPQVVQPVQTAGYPGKGKKRKTPPSPPCVAAPQLATDDPEAVSAAAVRTPCLPPENPYVQFLNSPAPLPLTPRQKGILAIRDVTDPFNILTITANAAFTVGINSHTGYGPGFKGFGYDVGISFVQDATGEFIGTFMVCSLLSQDPHYHRDPGAPAMKRLGHALKHTIISQHDDGRPMINYENLITYPASAEIANLYVPGIADNGPSTVLRILTGLATDPVNNIITEFLPDFARRVHIRIVFVQQLLNQIATSPQL